MRIDNHRPNASGPDKNLPPNGVTGPAEPRGAERVTRDRDDEVRIPDPGRALAVQHRADLAAAGDALSADRVAELRSWVQAGGFDEPAVVEQVARRLLASGEIQVGR